MRPGFSWLGRIFPRKTMTNRNMVALAEFTYPYGRAQIGRGQKFEAETDRDVEALTVTHLARIDEVKPPAKKRGEYQTRDMRAENEAAA